MKNHEWDTIEQEFLYYASLANKDREIMDIFRAASAGKATFDSIKLLSEYAGEIKDIQKHGEFMRIIGNLSLELAETQLRLTELIQTEINNQQKIKALEEELDQLKNPPYKLVVKKGLYYKENEEGGYCTGCYDNNRKLIHVAEIAIDVGAMQCPVCKTVYKQNFIGR